MTPTLRYDMVIVGGGMVGMALACALGDSGMRIAIVEGRESPMEWPQEGFDQRVSAITRASQQLFERLGVWHTMAAMRISPYREMHVWDASGQGSIHFDSADIGEPDLGHIIENRVIGRALAQRMEDFPNIHLLCPATPKRLRIRPRGDSILQLTDSRRLEAPLIVGADGANSWVRRQAGIEVDQRDYHQRAIVATVKTELFHGETAWQRFLPAGPLAFLPLLDGFSSIVWSTSLEQAEQLLAMEDNDFKEALGEAFEHKLGAISQLGARAAFPLLGQHAAQYVKYGLALIGDAAHTIHPLAGQGVNLGFGDAECLADTLLEARKGEDNPFAFKVLRRFERARRGPNQLTFEAMGIFKQVFSNDSDWLGPARNLGLDIADSLPPLKRLLMHQAMGTPHQALR